MNNSNIIRDKIKQEIKEIEKIILSHIDSSKKTVAFVSYLPNCRNQVGYLHKKFKEAGFNVINIVNEILNDRFEKQAPTFLINKQVKIDNNIYNVEVDFDFIDLIIAPDHEHITLPPYNEKFLSKKAKRIYLTHDVLNGNAFDCFDYVFMPSEPGIKNHLDKNYRKGFCLIPGGYPKLDYSIERYEKLKIRNIVKEDSILYAPTLRAQPVFKESEACFLVGFDAHIIETLLENFEEKIIFRPHPHDFNNEFYPVLVIKNKFKNYKNIIFNYESKYIDNYLRSKLIITDISDTVFTYSFTTLKPSVSFISFNYNEKSSVEGFNMEYRDYVGFTVKTLLELKEKINILLKNQKFFSENILKIREELVFNVGKSADYLINNLDYIFNGKKHQDWYYF